MKNMATELKENQINATDNETSTTDSKSDISFKTPTLLVGKIGRLPKKIQTTIGSNKNLQLNEAISTREKSTVSKEVVTNECSSVENKSTDSIEKPPETSKSPAQQKIENALILPYKEPSWSGLPETSGKPYVFEVLKNGSIIETIDLMKKPFWVFGRLLNCDICMQHPTISRYHAIIQYRDVPSEDDPPGFYVYDLGSTHGTFINNKSNKLKPRIYVPIRVGHILRLGCSQRSYILTGPEDDQEEESELSVTELKQLRNQKIKEHEERIKQAELEQEEKRKREEERGIDWGMGDDADDDEDIGENPYASTSNEELYLNDPKKALRGFFEREGVDLEYDCTEQGMGQFLCKVELPLDDEMGRPIVAEVLHRGKKKEAVVQCALEACRILDRFGVLRQATHESKKRKSRNWEENDYYDSDEDTYLDRTGTIEKKRQKRMKNDESEKAATYEKLVEKEKEISTSIAEIEKKLEQAQIKLNKTGSSSNADEDSLDSYMRELNEDKPDKYTVSKLKLELTKLRKNHASVLRVLNIAKPANLPPLVPTDSSVKISGGDKPKLPVFGKRKAIPVKFPAKPSAGSTVPLENLQVVMEGVENESEEDEESEVMSKELEKQETSTSSGPTSSNKEGRSTVGIDNECPRITRLVDNVISEVDDAANGATSSNALRDEKSFDSDSSDKMDDNYEQATEVMKEAMPHIPGDQYSKKLLKVIRRVLRLYSERDALNNYLKTIKAKKRQVAKWVEELALNDCANDALIHKVATEINRIRNEQDQIINDNIEIFKKLEDVTRSLNTTAAKLDEEIKALKRGADAERDTPSSNCVSGQKSLDDSGEEEMHNKTNENPEDGAEVDDKKKKKGQKRNEQRRQHKAELEKQRGYEEDASRENYNMWVPPSDQSGDGRTTLNDKFGY